MVGTGQFGKTIVTSFAVAVSAFLLLSIPAYAQTVSVLNDEQVYFVVSPPTGPAPLTMQFTSHITQGDAKQYDYYWTFGDGQNSTETNPRHTYTVPKTYTVTLTISNSIAPGEAGSYIAKVIVTAPTSTSTPTLMPGPGDTGGIPSSGPSGTSGKNSTGPAPANASVTPVPNRVSVIPGAVNASPGPSPGISSTPKPTIAAVAGGTSSGLGPSFTISSDGLQILIAAFIALVIAGVIIFVFNRMSKRPRKKTDAKPQKPAPKTNPKPPVNHTINKPAIKPAGKPANVPVKKHDDVSEDYLYGLVMGRPGDTAQPPGQSGGTDQYGRKRLR